MSTSRLLRMQPLRQAAFKQPVSATLRQVQQPLSRSARPFHSSMAMRRVKEDDQSAHTITQRLKSLKKVPPELLPLGVVIAFALFAAVFAMGRKLFTDKTLRLTPQREKH
ncbi:MAG: hypothetical protein M1823_007355 [Watsoniomyces obsoletus]|nr:MAG: hypothetical protein M1823_007355 [Watsoniomyces obsoletus]